MTKPEIEALVAEYLGTEFIRQISDSTTAPTPEERVAHAIRWAIDQTNHDFQLPEGTYCVAVELNNQEEVE